MEAACIEAVASGQAETLSQVNYLAIAPDCQCGDLASAKTITMYCQLPQYSVFMSGFLRKAILGRNFVHDARVMKG